MENIRETTDKAAVVDMSYPWLRIDKNTPQGKKIQLIREDYGVATYGVYTAENPCGWTHWAPLPTMLKGTK